MRTSSVCLALVLSVSGCTLHPGAGRSQGTYDQRTASAYERDRWEREQAYERDRYAREQYERDRYARDQYERERYERERYGHDNGRHNGWGRAQPPRDARYEGRGNAPRQMGGPSDKTVHVVGHGNAGQGSSVPIGGRAAPVHVGPAGGRDAPVHVSPGQAPARVVVQPAPGGSATSPTDNYVRPRAPVMRPASPMDRAGQPGGGSGAQDKGRGGDEQSIRRGTIRPH